MPRCPKCGSDLIGVTANPESPGPHDEFCFSCGTKWMRDGETMWDVRDERGQPVIKSSFRD
jgi:hypothetical protein